MTYIPVGDGVQVSSLIYKQAPLPFPHLLTPVAAQLGLAHLEWKPWPLVFLLWLIPLSKL